MEPIGINAAQARVERGMALLDEKFAEHDWLARVDLDTLDMSHGLHCIVLQVWGLPYWQVISSMGVWNCMSSHEAAAFMFRHGFDAQGGSEGKDEYYVQLTAAWKAAVSARRGQTDGH